MQMLCHEFALLCSDRVNMVKNHNFALCMVLLNKWHIYATDCMLYDICMLNTHGGVSSKFCSFLAFTPFSGLTLLVRQQERHLASKN